MYDTSSTIISVTVQKDFCNFTVIINYCSRVIYCSYLKIFELLHFSKPAVLVTAFCTSVHVWSNVLPAEVHIITSVLLSFPGLLQFTASHVKNEGDEV